MPLEQIQDRVADERIARDQGEDERQVDAGDRADDPEQVEQQQRADGDAERDVADPLQQPVAVRVAVTVVVELCAHVARTCAWSWPHTGCAGAPAGCRRRRPE